MQYKYTYIDAFFNSDCIQHIPGESCKRELPKYIDIPFLELKYLKVTVLRSWSGDWMGLAAGCMMAYNHNI